MPTNISFDVFIKYPHKKLQKFAGSASNHVIDTGTPSFVQLYFKTNLKAGQKVDLVLKPNESHALKHTTNIKKIWGKDIVFKDVLVTNRKDMSLRYTPHDKDNPKTQKQDVHSVLSRMVTLTVIKRSFQRDFNIQIRCLPLLPTTLAFDLYIKTKNKKLFPITKVSPSNRDLKAKDINNLRFRASFDPTDYVLPGQAFDIILKPTGKPTKTMKPDTKLYDKTIIFRNIKPDVMGFENLKHKLYFPSVYPDNKISD